MKKSIILIAAIVLSLAFAPFSFAKESSNVIIHNTISAELKVSKKITKNTKIAVTTGKHIFVNSFGDEFDAVEDDKGWYGIIGFEIEFE